MSYRIKTVEMLSGISRNTITAWERRYNLLSPTRDDSGYRSYSEDDVQKLRRIKALLDQGYQIGDVIPMVQNEVKQARPASTLDRLRDALRDRLMALDGRGAAAFAKDLAAVPIPERIDQVFMPLLQRVGTDWEQGRIGVAQEHFASVFVRDELLGMFRTLDAGPVGGMPVTCAGFPSETHELGLLGVAVRLALFGCRVTYLGADMPAGELIDALRVHPARVVCTSLLLPRPDAEVMAWADTIARSTPRGTVVALGGPGVAHLAPRSTERVRYCATFDELRGALASGRAVDTTPDA